MIKVHSLYSEQTETDLCVKCHTFTLHVHAWEKLNRLCVSISGLKFLFDSPFWGNFGQELFCKSVPTFVISQTKDENSDGINFKTGVGTRC